MKIFQVALKFISSLIILWAQEIGFERVKYVNIDLLAAKTSTFDQINYYIRIANFKYNPKTPYINLFSMEQATHTNTYCS